MMVAACGSPAPFEPTAAQATTSPPTSTATAIAPPPTKAPVPEAKPTATAIPRGPTQTPLPTPTVAEPPPVETEAALTTSARLASRAMEFLTEFTEDVSPRASGTQEEKAAADFLADVFADIGYDVRLQPFEVELSASDLRVGPDELEFRSFPLQLSGEGTASGSLEDAGGAFPEDIPAGGLTGKVALIERGTIPFEEKVTGVAEAGAIGAVIYNQTEGAFRGVLQSQAGIPAISLSRQDGLTILEMIGQGAVDATVTVTSEILSSHNVIAERAGSADDVRVVVLGGHYDTVPSVPGANDNGSGIATMFAIAAEIAERPYPFTVRFIAFGSEELGLRGSRFYVDQLSPEELESITVMLNFDALGASDVLGLLGDLTLTRQVSELANSEGIATRRVLTLGGLGSDHTSFQEAGIPAVFFLGEDVSRIHTPEDKLESVQPRLLGDSAALATEFLDSVASP